MPRIIPSGAPYPRSMLYWDGAAWRGVLRVLGVAQAVDVVTATWTNVVTYTVPAGRMATVMSWGVGLLDTGVELGGALTVGGVIQMEIYSDGTPIILPTGVWLAVAAGDVVRVRGYHLAGANRFMDGWLRYIEEDA